MDDFIQLSIGLCILGLDTRHFFKKTDPYVCGLERTARTRFQHAHTKEVLECRRESDVERCRDEAWNFSTLLTLILGECQPGVHRRLLVSVTSQRPIGVGEW